MKITSPAFEHGGIIPDRYSRNGEDRSPPLRFEGVPPDARSLVMIMDDPDAPRGTFTHWILFNLDPQLPGVRENYVPEEVKFGTNDWDEADYGGPRPPNGEHRYYFRLYALDCPLNLPNGASRHDIERAMETHVVAHAELMGRYSNVSAVKRL